MRDKDYAKTDVIILCGGLGTRLRTIVSDRPKVLAEIAGRPFLEILLDYINSFGFQRVILCAGYKGGQIEAYCRSRAGAPVTAVIKEKSPLGTGGALKNAARETQSETLLALNGDSFCRTDLPDFLDFHLHKKALLSLVLTAAENSADYGAVKLDGAGRVTGFSEKQARRGEGYISAGVYAFSRDFFNHIPTGKKLSLEYDIFPALLRNKVYGYPTREPLLDIGTPLRLQAARDFFTIRTKQPAAISQAGQIGFKDKTNGRQATGSALNQTRKPR